MLLAGMLRAEVAAAAADPPARWAPETERIFQDWGDALPPAQRRLLERVAELAAEPSP
ncbi:hypothetical protein [Pseudonocardia nigra]|uniref:hypothetical protein n=1 Tax=Pseudonocardia nigra TaxID=1921578 RepID=UPI001C5F0703|nr:hypothetical protein [Pseudonocardia nigra]